MKPGASVAELAERLGIDAGTRSASARRTGWRRWRRRGRASSSPGVFQEPKDIPESVAQASGAAACAMELLARGRGTMTRRHEYPRERDVTDEEPRVGVFICHCGHNIASVVDVDAVKREAVGLPNVVVAETNLYTCSDTTQDRIQGHYPEEPPEPGGRGVVLAAHARAALPGDAARVRAQPVPVRDDEHPRPVLVGAPRRSGRRRRRRRATSCAWPLAARAGCEPLETRSGADHARGAGPGRRPGRHDGGALDRRAGLRRPPGREGSRTRRQPALDSLHARAQRHPGVHRGPDRARDVAPAHQTCTELAGRRGLRPRRQLQEPDRSPGGADRPFSHGVDDHRHGRGRARRPSSTSTARTSASSPSGSWKRSWPSGDLPASLGDKPTGRDDPVRRLARRTSTRTAAACAARRR